MSRERLEAVLKKVYGFLPFRKTILRVLSRIWREII